MKLPQFTGRTLHIFILEFGPVVMSLSQSKIDVSTRCHITERTGYWKKYIYIWYAAKFENFIH